MYKHKTISLQSFSLSSILWLVVRAMYIVVVTSCNSIPSEGVYLVENEGLIELPIVYNKSLNNHMTVDLVEYTIATQDIIKSTEQGRVDLPDRFVYSQRKLFSITNLNNRFIDAESLFMFTREGFDSGTVESAIFFGRTGQDELPLTISLVADEHTRVFSGKSKRLRVVLDIEGTSYTKNSFIPNKTETGFYIRQREELLAFLNLTNPRKVFIKQDLSADVRKTVLYTVAFLFHFERYNKYTVNPKLIKGE